MNDSRETIRKIIEDIIPREEFVKLLWSLARGHEYDVTEHIDNGRGGQTVVTKTVKLPPQLYAVQLIAKYRLEPPKLEKQRSMRLGIKPPT